VTQDLIPVLVDLDERPSQAKRLTPDGLLPAGKPTHFTPEYLPADTILTLLESVAELRHRPEASANRWQFKTDPPDGEGFPRRKTHMVEHARRWVMLDIDFETEVQLAFSGDPARAARLVRALLPEPFRAASCVWHASGSAGVKPGVRLHLWFLLTDALTGAQCKRWLRAHRHVADPALYHSIQVHYTADPILDRMADPMAARLGHLPGPERVQVPADVLEYVPEPAVADADVEDLEPRPTTHYDVKTPPKPKLAPLQRLKDGRADAAYRHGKDTGAWLAAEAWNHGSAPQDVFEDRLQTTADSIVDALSHQPNARPDKYMRDATRGLHEGFAEAWVDYHNTARPKPPIEVTSGSDIFAPLPPLKYLCRDLGIGPGRPTLLIGYGASGKTMFAQSLALSIAANRQVCGKFPAQIGRVLHIDAEMGKQRILSRYQRLARGMGIAPRDVADRLHVASHAGVYLDGDTSEARLAEILDAFVPDVVVLDSLAALTPSLDENDSQIRTSLDILSRLSDQRGCTFIVIHHAGKSERADARQTARGSSAIFDAADNVIQFDATVNRRSTVSQTKSPAQNFAPFTIEIQDVGDPLDESMRVQVVADADVFSARLEADEEKVLEIIGNHPGCALRLVRNLAGIRAARVKDVVEGLVESGRVLDAGSGRKTEYTIAPESGRQPRYDKTANVEDTP